MLNATPTDLRGRCRPKTDRVVGERGSGERVECGVIVVLW